MYSGSLETRVTSVENPWNDVVVVVDDVDDDVDDDEVEAAGDGVHFESLPLLLVVLVAQLPVLAAVVREMISLIFLLL